MRTGALAYLGVPGATPLTDAVIVLGSAAIAAYLVLCGRRGVKAAQVIAPSAAAFALVALAAAVTSVGGLGESLTAPATTGGLCGGRCNSAGAGGDRQRGEIAVLPFLHGSGAARLLEAPGPVGEKPERRFHGALRQSGFWAAIGAAHQGVFDLDFRAQLLTLSPEASALLGLGIHEATLSHSDFIGHIHPEDRDALSTPDRKGAPRPGPCGWNSAPAIRRRTYRWLELRAAIVSDQDVPSDCLGLLADITDRKEMQQPTQDPLTGLETRRGF